MAIIAISRDKQSGVMRQSTPGLKTSSQRRNIRIKATKETRQKQTFKKMYFPAYQPHSSSVLSSNSLTLQTKGSLHIRPLNAGVGVSGGGWSWSWGGAGGQRKDVKISSAAGECARSCQRGALCQLPSRRGNSPRLPLFSLSCSRNRRSFH